MSSSTHVVIVGTGFGGLYTYLTLRKRAKRLPLRITLINRTNHFLFTPMLHEVATGGLQPQNIVEAIRHIIRHDAQTSFLEADVLSIDTDKRVVHTDHMDVAYDQLVLATGATTNFYATPGAEKYTFVLKELVDAERLKEYFIECFERVPASHLRLSFAIVGGGATGVELAGELSELLFETFHDYYKHGTPRQVELHLIHRSGELLQAFHPHLRGAAAEALRRKGVTLHFNSTVVGVQPDSIELADGSTIPVQGTIWVSGVKANIPSITPAPVLDQGRIPVDAFLQMMDRSGVWVVGDAAASKDPKGEVYPMLAQVAVAEGRSVGENIIRQIQHASLTPFCHRPLGQLVSLGQYHAVGDFSLVRLSGFMAWFIWRTVYLSKFSSWSKRLRIAVDWTLNFFYPRDIVKWK